MLHYVAKRLLLFLPTMFLVTVVIFVLMRLVPGDPALIILGGTLGEGHYTQEDLENLRQDLGTDRSLVIQYGDWVWGLLSGDLGNSLFYQLPVVDDIGPRLPLTIELAIMASILGFIMAVPLGILSAVKQDTFIDYAARLFSFTGISVPIFVSGLVVVYLLVRVFGWFPPLGYTTPWDDPWENLQQMIFPAITLAFYQMNFTARVTRSAMLEVMREDYIRTARAKGLAESVVLLKHTLKNSIYPIVSVLGPLTAGLVTGSFVIEFIFSIPFSVFF